METKRMMGRVNIIQQRIKFLASLTYNPKFYRIINDVVGDPSKLDMTLGTLCYSTLFLSAIIKRFPKIKSKFLQLYKKLVILINSSILSLLTKLRKEELKSSLLLKPVDDTKTEELSASTLKTADTLKDFSGYLTDIRIFNRGFSIPGCISDILESGTLFKDKDYLNWMSSICISLYQPLETIAFLFDHDWLLPGRISNNCNWWYAISTRFWFAWVIAEFGQLTHKIIRNRGRNIDKSEYIGFIENLATLPLCVHWSLEEGWLDPLYVGFFGTIAGGLSTMEMWKDIWSKILIEV